MAICTSWSLTGSLLCTPSLNAGCHEDHFIREMETVMLGALRNGAHSTQMSDGSCFFSTVSRAAFPGRLRLHVPRR